MVQYGWGQSNFLYGFMKYSNICEWYHWLDAWKNDTPFTLLVCSFIKKGGPFERPTL